MIGYPYNPYGVRNCYSIYFGDLNLKWRCKGDRRG